MFLHIVLTHCIFQPEARKAVVLSSLSEFFCSDQMLNPIDYLEKDWAKEPYNGGCPVNFVSSGVMSQYSQQATAFHRCGREGNLELSWLWVRVDYCLIE